MKLTLAPTSWIIVAGIWLAFVLAIVLALPRPPNPVRVTQGALLGIPIIVIGFWATARSRPVIINSPIERVVRIAYSIVAGAMLGALLLSALLSLAHVEPRLRARFAGRAGEPAWRPFALAYESSIIEEVVFRLFILSLTALCLNRVIQGRNIAFPLALIISTLLFGLAHLSHWLVLTGPSIGLIAYVLALNGMAGLLFGWIFWHWGLPYAILCHAAGDVIVQSFAPRLL